MNALSPDSSSLPTVTEAIGAKPLPYSQAVANMRLVSDAVLCAILHLKGGSKQVHNLWREAVRADLSQLPKGATLAGYVVARSESLIASGRTDEYAEVLSGAARESRQARADWAYKNRRR